MTDLHNWDTKDLLDLWDGIEHQEATHRENRQRVEVELRRRMKAEGATAIPHERLTCELKAGSPDYDYGKLNRLRELLRDDVIQTAWTPAHLEMVPDRWDARTFKTWGKYGNDVARVIEEATIPATPVLRIGRKELPAKTGQ